MAQWLGYWTSNPIQSLGKKLAGSNPAYDKIIALKTVLSTTKKLAGSNPAYDKIMVLKIVLSTTRYSLVRIPLTIK